jgi:sugar lactone lactonase YvrE
VGPCDPFTPPQILIVNPSTGGSRRLDITFQNDAVLNGITFDGAGNTYVSDSRNGRIYQIPVGNPAGTNIWTERGGAGDPLLMPALQFGLSNPPNPLLPVTGITPQFGANGIEFNPLRCNPLVTPNCALLVANTANRTILELLCCDPANPGKANPATVLINGVNGPDGIAIDPDTGLIWVAANQSDEIVVMQPLGVGVLPRVVAKLGDFNGIAAVPNTNPVQGRVRGLLFPTSLAFGPNGMGQKTLWVANSAFTGANSTNTLWGQAVTAFSVANFVVPAITPCPATPPTLPIPPGCGLLPP